MTPPPPSSPNGTPGAPETVAIVGLGYVGLPTAIAFARAGLEVAGLDIDQARVDRLRKGDNPLRDAALGDLGGLVESKRFVATTDPAEAITGKDAVILAVPTPITETKDPDLSYVEAAARSIGPHLTEGTLVVLESTVYPGATQEVLVPALDATLDADLRIGEDIGVAYCPERLNPGDPEHGVDGVVRVLGANEPRWAEKGQALYSTIVPEIHLVRDTRTAEAAKVIENVQRDLNIALVNELSLIFDRMDLDVHEVLDAAATKWNFHRYNPGPGVGGHCLPVDPYYLTWKAQSLGFHPQVILAGRSTNDGMPEQVVQATIGALNEVGRPVKNTRIAVLGLTYKPNTSDARNSPALQITQRLADMGADLAAVDPWLAEDGAQDPGLTLHELDDALDGAQAVLLLVPHDAFEDLDADRLTEHLQEDAVVVDTTALLDPAQVRQAGLGYRALGRP